MTKSSDILSNVPELDYVEKAAEVNVQEFKKVLESRRSVRVYTEEKIPDEVVQDCLKMATLAPSSSNLQPWEIYWVESEVKKERSYSFVFESANS